MSAESTKRTAPDPHPPYHPKRTRFDIDSDSRSSSSWDSGNRTPPRGPSFQRRQSDDRPPLRRVITDRSASSVYDRREDRDTGRRASSDFHRPSLSGRDDVPSNWNAYRPNYQRRASPTRNRDPERLHGWEGAASPGNVTTSGGSSPAVHGSERAGAATVKPLVNKEARRDSIVTASPAEQPVPSPLKSPEAAMVSNNPTTHDLHVPQDSPPGGMTASAEQLVTDVLNGLPDLIQSSITQAKAFEQREKGRLVHTQRAKFFEHDDKRKSDFEDKLTEWDVACEKANLSVRQSTNSIKTSLLHLLENIDGSSGTNKDELKAIQQTLNELESKQEKSEKRLQEKDHEIATLKKCLESHSRIAGDHAKSLKSLTEQSTSLKANAARYKTECFQAIKDAETSLRNDWTKANAGYAQLKINTEASVAFGVRETTVFKQNVLTELDVVKNNVKDTRDQFEAKFKDIIADLKQTEEAANYASIELEAKFEDSRTAAHESHEAMRIKLDRIERELRSLPNWKRGQLSNQASPGQPTEDSGTMNEPTAQNMKAMNELKAEIEKVRTGLGDLQDLVENGVEDDDGTQYPSIVARQSAIEDRLGQLEAALTQIDGTADRLDRCEARFTEIDNLYKLARDLGEKLQHSSGQGMPKQLADDFPILVDRVQSLEKERDARQDGRVAPLQVPHDMQALQYELSILRTTKANSGSIDKLQRELNGALVEIGRLHQMATLRDPQNAPQADFMKQLEGTSQNFHTALQNTDTRLSNQIAAMRHAVKDLNYRYDTLNTTQMARQILDQLNPGVLLAREPAFQNLENSIHNIQKVNMGQHYTLDTHFGYIKTLQEEAKKINQAHNVDITALKQELAQRKDTPVNEASDGSKEAKFAEEIYSRFETWSTESKERMLSDINAQVSNLTTTIDSRLGALPSPDDIVKPEAMNELKERIEALEERKYPDPAVLAEVKNRCDRLRAQMDDLTSSSSHDTGPGLNIRGNSTVNGGQRSPTTFEPRSAPAALLQRSTTTPTHPSGGLFGRVTRDGETPPPQWAMRGDAALSSSSPASGRGAAVTRSGGGKKRARMMSSALD